MYHGARRTGQLLLALVAALSVGILAAGAPSGTPCGCPDPPDTPCIRQWLVLESIRIPYQVWDSEAGGFVRSSFHEEVERHSDAVWVIIQVYPFGPGDCHWNCRQIYVWYAPKVSVDPNDAILLSPSDPRRTAGNVVFLMDECSAAREYRVQITVVASNEDYDDTWKRVSKLLDTEGAYEAVGEHDPDSWTFDETGWSVRATTADTRTKSNLERLQDTLLAAGKSAYIVGIHPLDGPKAWEYGTSFTRAIYEGLNQALVTFRAYSEEISASYACSVEAAKRPSQAEQYQSSSELSTAGAPAANAPAGYTTTPGGAPGVPANVTQMATKRTTATKTEENGTKIRFTQIILHLRFSDYSDYIYWKSVKEVIDANGKRIELTEDTGDGSWDGANVGKGRSRGEVTRATSLRREIKTWGGGAVYAVPPAIEPPDDALQYDAIDFAVSQGTTLDLSALPRPNPLAAMFGSPGGISATESIDVWADDILLAEGAAIGDVLRPTPDVHPAVDRADLRVLDTCVFLPGENVLDVPVVNLSGTAHELTVEWRDERGWAAPGSRTLFLEPGEAALVEVPISVSEAASGQRLSSLLTLAIPDAWFDGAATTVEVLAGAEEAPVVETPVVEAPAPVAPAEQRIPADVLACTNDVGEASGTDYKNSGYANHQVPSSQRLAFFLDELAAYRDCLQLGPCVRTVEAWLATAPSAKKTELAGVFWEAFRKAN